MEENIYTGTGKTTGIALEVIGKCLQNPGKVFEVKDHWGTRKMDSCCLGVVQRLVTQLDLRGFEFNRSSISVKYNI